MYKMFFKRILDILIAIIALLLLSPIFLIVAILVKFKLGSPVIFYQERPGRNEKIFKMYKFRSMTNQCDSEGKLLPDEKRLTTFGKRLRTTSLDELPELFNILKGDMSLVGPRPLMARYLPYYTEIERKRHNVRPGLTGYAQVKGRNSLTWEERFKYDLEYIECVSFFTDVWVIFETIKTVSKREGIFLGDLDNLDDYRKKKE